MRMVAGRATRRKAGLARESTWSLPPLLPTLACSLGWGLAAGLCALSGVMTGGWETPSKIRALFLLFGLGGVIAFPFGLFLAQLLTRRARTETAFAAAFVAFSATTIGATAGLFGLQYREYYAHWHAEPFTRIWFLQFTHTLAAAFYQFAALGMRLYFPFGFVALLAASLWFARHQR